MESWGWCPRGLGMSGQRDLGLGWQVINFRAERELGGLPGFGGEKDAEPDPGAEHPCWGQGWGRGGRTVSSCPAVGSSGHQAGEKARERRKPKPPPGPLRRGLPARLSLQS